MTRKKFIKELMGVGISRNTATAAADAASRAEIPLIKAAGRILCMQRLFVGRMAPVKYWRKTFDQALRTQAENTPRRIRPLAKKRHQDGLRIDFAMVDEMSHYRPQEMKIYDVSLVASGGYPLGGGGHE